MSDVKVERDRIGDVFFVRATRRGLPLASGIGNTPGQARNQCYLALLMLREDIDEAGILVIQASGNGEAEAADDDQ